MIRSLLVLLCCAWFGIAAAEEPARHRVRGSVDAGTGPWQARDAWSFEHSHGLTVLVAGVDLDPAVLLADGKLDQRDVQALQAAGIPLLKLELDVEPAFVVSLLLSGTEGRWAHSVPGSEVEQALRFETADGRASGVLDLPGIELAFSTLVLPVAPSRGKSLPADGGAPGAVLAGLLAAQADSARRDWLQLLHPQLLAQWRERAGRDERELAAAMRGAFPHKLAQLRGVLDGERAELHGNAPDGGHWIAVLQQIEGGWRVRQLEPQGLLPAAGELGRLPAQLYQDSMRAHEKDILFGALLRGLMFAIGLAFVVALAVLVRKRRRVQASGPP